MLCDAYYTPKAYLFGSIEQRIKEAERELGRAVIRLSLGDVTCPVAPCVAQAMARASEELGRAETFRGYPPSTGYAFAKEAISRQYQGLIEPDEIYISDGAKSDLAGWASVFDKSIPALIPNPSYPVYRDSSELEGREVIDLECNESTDYIPKVPSKPIRGIVYLCSPANPTGKVISNEALSQWVEYAKHTHSIILYDAAYQAFVQDGPRSICEIEG
ncbi:MAG: aminotransferase class I/II-fold pyridoxal phosphate-dependent enzyme, partial [Clostridia bacterium]|nr:aminotransferase class I/II-fold pyridoxal phosphate-dependent enzyme [Clostridia bacterium]